MAARKALEWIGMFKEPVSGFGLCPKTSCLWYCLKRDAAFQKLFLLLLQISATNEALQVLNDASEDLSRGLKDLVELLKPFGKVHT